MGKLCVYGVFHANLSFSYIPKDFYPQIVRRCYWPLLRIVEERNIPLGLEFNAYTLEVVNSLDPSFVARLRELWDRDVCEVIGAGYVQAIMPLIPARVNRENLRYGNEVYERLLGRRPRLAYVNEQVYSAGLPRLYRDAGYDAIIANWESSVPGRADPETLYSPCDVEVAGGGRLPVIWHSIGAYRQFQEYVENHITLEAYLNGLLSNVPESGERVYPIYGSDWEVFDFKPWQAHPDGFDEIQRGEMPRIADLMSLLSGREDLEFISPGAILERFSDRPLLRLESSEYPLPYKKQYQHSMLRWAVGGRDTVRLNTQCYGLYQQLLLADWHSRHLDDSTELQGECEALWKELCFLWSSDYRTFTTEEKYLEYRNRMGAALDRVGRLLERCQPSDLVPDEVRLTNRSPVPAGGEPVPFSVSANGAGMDDGLAYELQLNDSNLPCQVTRTTSAGPDATRLTLEALPAVAPERTEVGRVRTSPPPDPGSRAEFHIDTQRHIIETPFVRLSLLPESGGAIGELAFPEVFSEPLVSALSHSSLPRTPADSWPESGQLYLEDWLGEKVTDHRPAEIQYPERGEQYWIFIPVRCYLETQAGMVWKTYRVYLNQPRVDLIVRFRWLDVVPKSFRLGGMALSSTAFDRNTLYYATTNGGEDVERFPLSGKRVRHGEALEADVTARGCLGATEGWAVLGDAEKGLGYVTRPADLYSVPMVRYEEFGEGPPDFLLSLSHSLGEKDETSHTLWRGHSTWSLTILGGGDDIVPRTAACASLANGGLVAWSALDSGSAKM